MLAWSNETDGELDPTLRVLTPDATGWSYRLEGRLRFRGVDETWEQDLCTIDALMDVEVELAPAALISASDEQDAWASDLMVAVVATDTDGPDVARSTTQVARLVFYDGMPLLLSGDAAVELAPSGAFSADAIASLPTAEVGVQLEVGGAAGIESDGDCMTDLLVSAPYRDDVGQNAGMVYLMTGLSW